MEKKLWTEPALKALNIRMTATKGHGGGGPFKPPKSGGSGSHASGGSQDDSCPDVGFDS